jgi:hypothetical protein
MPEPPLQVLVTTELWRCGSCASAEAHPVYRDGEWDIDAYHEVSCPVLAGVVSDLSDIAELAARLARRGFHLADYSSRPPVVHCPWDSFS